MKKSTTLLFFCLLTFSAIAQERRLALIIGNGAYNNVSVSALPNPVPDAKKMENALRECKFDIFDNRILQNANKKTMRESLTRFAQSLKNYDVGLIFYAGHGINVKGQNYFVPIDFDVNTGMSADLNEANAPDDCISLENAQTILRTAGEYNKSYIIISDACRNNPFRSLKRDIIDRKSVV